MSSDNEHSSTDAVFTLLVVVFFMMSAFMATYALMRIADSVEKIVQMQEPSHE